MKRITVAIMPFITFQHIYVLQNKELIHDCECTIDELSEILYAVAKEYDVHDIEFLGTPKFNTKLKEEIEKDCVTKYDNYQLNITLVGGKD